MILECQEKHKAKVLKHGIVKKRKGYWFKNYKPYRAFLLDNGMIILYTLTLNSKKFGKESDKHRIQLDETLRITDKKTVDANIKQVKGKESAAGKDGQLVQEQCNQFTLRIGNTQTHFQSPKSDNWINYLENELRP